MYALKTPSFLRPSSRPTSPAPRPDSAMADRPSRSSILSFSNLKRTASPLTKPATPVVQDGSYMDVLNLKLSEAVSKALAHPTTTGPGPVNELLNGRRPIPLGRGRALGDLIISELNASCENLHLRRAVIRTLHRPLSVLVNNLSSNLLPLISSPAFLSPAAPTQQNPTLNPTQLHALGLASLAGELVDIFDQNGLGQEGNDTRGDGLRVVKEGLVSIVKRVVEPLMNAIKNELGPHVEALEMVNSTLSLPSNANGAIKSGAATKSLVHPSIAFMQTMFPIYGRALTRYATSSASESVLASLLIPLIWRGLVALANRPNPPPSPPTSPSLGAGNILGSGNKKRRGSSVTPPTTPPASRFTLKLPPSRPPSPPMGSTIKGSTAAGDARAFYDLLWSLPKPSETNKLAYEAVLDAFDALASLTSLLETIQMRQRSKSPIDPKDPRDLEKDLEILTSDLPTLIALPILLRTYIFPVLPPLPAQLTPEGGQQQAERSVAGMLGLTEKVYRAGCVSGFSRAEDCTVAVGERVLAILRDEVGRIRKGDSVGGAGVGGGLGAKETEVEVVLRWLERDIAIVAAETAEEVVEGDRH
ncbi:hypothetical protein QCA50_011518 [Cerrena zonata]|uniref:Uncharacterized protein n=1 Tax=Cerrena zonata TaxID=2478898 RepID=A0AAW0FVA4_9APHY